MMVWNRSADKARATGLKVAETPAELAAASEGGDQHARRRDRP